MNVGSRSPGEPRIGMVRLCGRQNTDHFPLIKHQSGGVTRTQLVVRRIASFSSTEGRGITLGFWLGGVGT